MLDVRLNSRFNLGTIQAMNIEHLVLPMAGLGKRLRPLTLRTSKNLLKVNGVPLVRYALDEIKGTDIKTVVAIVSPKHEGQFKKYFKTIQPEFPGITFIIRAQKDLFGDGHAVLQAKDIVGNRPCLVRFPDDILINKKPILHSLIDIYNKVQAQITLLMKVPMKDVSRYGVFAVKKGKMMETGMLYPVTAIVEKPERKDAPSNLVIIGGYTITPEVMKRLEKIFAKIKNPQNDALRIADALTELAKEKKTLYGWAFPGKRLDCGTLENFYKSEEFLKKHSKRQ
jgi:UTP--glucose-1-phosphate uridylyltransferase